MLKEKILKALKYKREPFEKRISASQINNSLYEILMSIKYGAIDSTSINNATIGSILHKGLECMFKNEPMLEAEKELSYKFRDWDITGTIDLYDNETKTIYDYKFVKKAKVNGSKSITGLKEKLMRGLDDDYFWQLHTLRYLAQKNGLEVKRLILFTISPDAGWDNKNKKYVNFDEELEIPIEYYPDDEIEYMLNYLIDRLEDYVDFENKKVMFPDNCGSKERYGFLTYGNGNKTPKKCELYCSYKDVCKQYRSKNLNNEWRI